MSKRLSTAAAVVAGCAIAAAATRAQEPSPTTLTATVRATPAKAGTARRPVGVRLQGHLELTTPEGVAYPLVTGFDLWYGPGIGFNGDRYATCSKSTLSHGGPSRCPRTSIVGSGQLPDGPRDLAELVPWPGQNVTFINTPGGMVAWIVLKNPARVAAAAVGTVVDDAPGPWPHRASFTIPRSLQVVAGIPITPRELSFAIGGKSYAPKYMTSTTCPKGGWAWKVRVHTRAADTGATAVLETHGRAPCHR
jgi:hypothetical protein